MRSTIVFYPLLSCCSTAFHRKQLQPSPITRSDRQVRNIRAQYELSNGDFPREGKKRARKKKIKKRIFGRTPSSGFNFRTSPSKRRYLISYSPKTGERPFGNWRQPLNTRNQAMLNTPCIVHNPPYSYASSFLLHAIPPQLSHISDASSPERAASHSPASSLV